MNVISLDYETEYQKKVYGIRELGTWHYLRDPRFNCYLLSVCDDAETWAGHPRDFNWEALRGNTVVAHNNGFDSAVTERLQELDLIPKDLGIVEAHCTANLAAYLTKRRALADVIKYLYGVDLSKDMRDYMSGKTWKDAVAAGKDKEMIEYARRDAYWCRRIWTDHAHKWPELERELSRLTIEQSMRGVAIDIEKLTAYLHAAQAELIRIETTLPWYKQAKPTSVKAINEECNKVGIPCPPIKNPKVKSDENNEEAFLEWDKTYSPRFDWILKVSNWRSTNKLLGTLETIKERLRPDSTIEAPLLYFGAHTGRWAGTGGLNFTNLRKEPLQCGDVAVDIRSLIIPRPGCKMITCDLAQVEPRILDFLAGNEDMMQALRAGFSIYEAHARLYKDWKGEPGTIKKSLGQAAYTKLKNEKLGLGYGMGKARYSEYAGITEEEADEVVKDYRARQTHTTALWKQLDDAFKRSVMSPDKTFEMELPSGRVMKYDRVRRGMKVRVDKKTGKVSKEVALFADVMKSGRVQAVSLYGGLLTENLIQATARDVFAEHLVSLHKKGLQVLFHVYDEAILEVPPEVTAKEIEDEMSKTPAWLKGCPLGAEATEVAHYRK